MPGLDRRIGFLFGVFLVLLLLGAGRALWLGVVKGDSLQAAAAIQQKSDVQIPARRGTITDVNGSELAVSQPSTSIAATPYLVRDPIKVAGRLARILRMSEDDLLRKLSRKDTGFVWLARSLPDRAARRIRKLGIAGLEFVPGFRRVYPRDWMAAQLLGIVGVDGHGLDGLEFALDGRLRGADGRRRLVKDALGDTIELRDTRATEPGQRVRLTLDANIQDRTEEVLAEVGREWKPKGATALVMDPRDGAILAMANWPQVDANDLLGAPDYAKQNRAIGANYEPGSTFKPFTVAGALEDGKVTPRTQFSLPPVLQVADRTIKEAHDRGWTTLDTSQILAQSSNIGTVKIGQELGKRRFDHWIRRFGFGGPTGVDLPGEEAGIVPSVEQYSGASIGNLPIGQGLAVTPMQIAAAYAAIANGGILRPPHMVEAVGGQRARKPAGRRIVSRHTAAAIAKMLEGVLGPGGTATGAKIDGYAVAGKTGTAQKPIPGGYSATKYVASFAGFAPVRNPRLLVTVMVDEPQGDIYGGSIAAPAFKKITSFALNYLAIPPD